MRLAFTKMQGLGNDFIVFDAPADGPLPDARSVAPARRPPHRHRLRPGAGARCRRAPAAPMSTTASSTPTAPRSSNAATARAASPAWSHGKLGRERASSMDSPGGRVDARVARRRPRIASTWACRISTRRRCRSKRRAKRTSIRCASASRSCEIGAVSMGNPHAVIQVAIGARRARGHARPRRGESPALSRTARMSASWKWSARSTSGLRVFERGVGRDAGLRHRRMRAQSRSADGWVCCRRKCRSTRPGGRMIVRWPGPGETSWLTGPAVTVFEGTVERAKALTSASSQAKLTHSKNCRGADEQATRGSVDDESPSERDRIADYLQRNPDFFERHATLLHATASCRTAAAAPTVSLVERQVQVLREKNEALERGCSELIDVARANDVLADEDPSPRLPPDARARRCAERARRARSLAARRLRRLRMAAAAARRRAHRSSAQVDQPSPAHRDAAAPPS